jgi:hypothetical protein
LNLLRKSGSHSEIEISGYDRKDLMVRHAIDVMHVEKNVCEALIGTMLDIPGKIKDTLKAPMDLEEMKLRKDL